MNNNLSAAKLRNLRVRSRAGVGATKIVTIALALFALLAVGAAREASAQVTTLITINNNTPSTPLNYVGITNYGSQGAWNDQQWLTTYPTSWGPVPSCFLPSGPPSVIAPGQTVCFVASATGAATNGTGGAMSYRMAIPPEYDSNNNQIPNAPTATVAFAWTVPYASQGFLNGILGTYADANTPINVCFPQGTASNGFQPQCTNAGNETTGAGLNYGSVAAVDANSNGGSAVQFQLNQTAPLWSANAVTQAYSGQQFTVQGANFDTNGFTQILFGSVPLSGVSCPTSTQCSATLPSGFAAGADSVTINVYGALTSAGTFTFLPTPNCTYAAQNQDGNPDVSQPSGSMAAECTSDAAQDPIVIFAQTSAGEWTYFSGYTLPQYGNGGEVISTGLTDGTAETLLACVWNASDFPDETSWMNQVAPGLYGCDPTPTAVTIPTCVPSLTPANTCDANSCEETFGNGCGGFFTCPACQCLPASCEAIGAVCGYADPVDTHGNSCGQPIPCGTCPSGDACSADRSVCCPEGEPGADGVCCAPGESAGAGHCCPNGSHWQFDGCVKDVPIPHVKG